MKQFINRHKKDIIYNLIFIVTYLIIVLLITHGGKYVLGSKIDFEMQHYTIPEYLRQLFYDTHNFFPSFAPNLAGGENIYYLSYYGLFNPIILISYLFPFVSMLKYIIISMGVIVLSSTSMLYFYLKKNKYSEKVCFIGSFLFLCSAPLIFHSHRHIMFIDYFPFLLLSFYGVDLFIEKKKSFLLIIGLSLMILTSYYFSIAGMLTVYLLGIYKYVKTKKKDFFKYLASFTLRFIPPIFSTAILTLPTLYTLLNGRIGNKAFLNIFELIKPKLDLLYSHYSIGLTLISVVSVVYAIKRKERSENFLGISIAIITISPVIAFILNGFLYASSKVTIPFTPLVIILIAEFLAFILPKIKRQKLLIAYVLIAQLVVCLLVNFHDELIPIEELKSDFYNNYSSIIKKLDKESVRINDSQIDKSYVNKIGDINQYKTTAYSSVHNKYYKENYTFFFENPLNTRNKFILSSSNNILFEMYMGEKYILSKETLNEPYELVNKYENVNVYKNDYVLPIGYATNEYINNKDLEKLEYPENILNILGRVTTNEKTNTNIRKVEKINPEYELISSKNLEYKKIRDGYIIKADDSSTLKLKTKQSMQNKLLFIKFDLEDNEECSKEDLSIKINEVTNLLTCKKWKYYNENNIFTYTITNGETLNISFIKGTYKISNIEFYQLDIDELKTIKDNVIPFNIDKNKTKGDRIIGNIDVSTDSLFTISIPYDKGFNIKVNGKKIYYTNENNSFIAFPIKKGNNDIEIIYTAPLKNISLVISIIGILITFITVIIERKRFI